MGIPKPVQGGLFRMLFIFGGVFLQIGGYLLLSGPERGKEGEGGGRQGGGVNEVSAIHVSNFLPASGGKASPGAVFHVIRP